MKKGTKTAGGSPVNGAGKSSAGAGGLDIGVKSFITSIVILLCLMIVTYILTFIIPGGQYDTTIDSSGNELIDTNSEFREVEGGLPFWKWLLSPLLVMTASGGTTVIAVIFFLLVIGGAFNCLTRCGMMGYMLDKIVNKYGKNRYRLQKIVILFFMLLGALVGSFEECVPFVPIVVALAAGLGWDALTGLGMSLLAIGCGFASGVMNPFTVGVAQSLAGLPMFSGIWLRAVSFVLIYGLVVLFVGRHSKKIEKPIEELHVSYFEKKDSMEKSLRAFVAILIIGILLIISSSFVKALQSYTMVIVIVMFLVAGILSPALSGMKAKTQVKTFGKGVVSVLPAVLMILMAASIKYTLTEAHILDTILHAAVQAAGTMPRWGVVLFIYLITLVMNFFISSGSAKAFMLIPVIVPLAGVFGISAQLCILAFAFGDGFSNVFYPTNPVLLISLSLSDTSYGKWFKWSWKFQALNLLMTCLILMFGLAVGY